MPVYFEPAVTGIQKQFQRRLWSELTEVLAFENSINDACIQETNNSSTNQTHFVAAPARSILIADAIFTYPAAI